MIISFWSHLIKVMSYWQARAQSPISKRGKFGYLMKFLFSDEKYHNICFWYCLSQKYPHNGRQICFPEHKLIVLIALVACLIYLANMMGIASLHSMQKMYSYMLDSSMLNIRISAYFGSTDDLILHKKYLFAVHKWLVLTHRITL